MAARVGRKYGIGARLSAGLLLSAWIWLALGALPAGGQAPTADLKLIKPSGSKRVALVVGMSSYQHIPTLDNPKNDAQLMAETLRSLGFTLVGDGAQLDLDKPAFDHAIQMFGQQIVGAEAALFYYAGHGLQVAGTNWLVPTTANPTREVDLDFQMVDANLVLRQMESAGTKLNLMILDACRNNPFGGRGLRAASGGLAQMKAPEGTLISYATQPGNVAADGQDGDSPYTEALARTMKQPGLDVFKLFNEVGLQVKRVTGGVQQPWVSSSPIDGEFYFATPSASVAAPLLGASPADRDALFWSSVKDSRNPAEIQAYLDAFPQGAFAGLAKILLAQLAAVPARPDVRPPSAAGGYPVDAGQSFRDCPNCPEMVVLPAGTFGMGSRPSETTREDVPYEFAMQECPQHSVRVGAPLAVGKFHVTRGEFARFVQASGHQAADGCYVRDGAKVSLDAARSWRDPGFAQTDRDPVVCVSWQDAQAYARWLSRETARGYRLPTEAEWEYAARGGTSSARWWSDSSGEQCRYANGGEQSSRGGAPPDNGPLRGCDDGFAYTSPAGSFPANPFGLHDMLGDAFQWVEDCWQSSYAGAPGDAALAMIAGDCGLRVLRGGSWFSVPWTLRAAYRINYPGDYRGNDVGFRVARAPAA